MEEIREWRRKRKDGRQKSGRKESKESKGNLENRRYLKRREVS